MCMSDFFFKVDLSVCIGALPVHCVACSTREGQKRALNPLGLKLQILVDLHKGVWN